MNELTLVLPFALPPPELAADLIRALTAPSLATLVSRTSAKEFHPFDNSTRILPHEAWLSHALGLGVAPGDVGSRSDAGDAADASAAFAVAAMRGFGLAPSDGYWFIVHPIHVQISRNHLLMGDLRELSIDEADGRALFEAAKPYFDEAGKPLLYGDAGTWFVRADDWRDFRTASPDAAAGQNLTAWMPEGAQASACRKLQNEIQMLWYEHPVNEAREARRLPPLNAFWLWGGAAVQAATASPARLIADGPAWLTALSAPANAATTTATKATPVAAIALETLLAGADASALLCLDCLSGPALAGDWSDWLMHMQRLEQGWFAPLQSALAAGRLSRLTLVLDHRDAWASFSSGKNARFQFWRTPTLNGLTP